jgi:hypothetical protein
MLTVPAQTLLDASLSLSDDVVSASVDASPILADEACEALPELSSLPILPSALTGIARLVAVKVKHAIKLKIFLIYKNPPILR